MQLVDLATGVCTPQPALLHTRYQSAAARMLDGLIVCAGGINAGDVQSTAETWKPPVEAVMDEAWTLRALPAMSVGRYGCCGCMMSDGCFAVLGGWSNEDDTSLCEALLIGNDEHWHTLPPMHDSRAFLRVRGCGWMRHHDRREWSLNR